MYVKTTTRKVKGGEVRYLHLRPPNVDRVLPCLRSRLINQIHQRLCCCQQITVTVGPGFTQFRHERRLPGLRRLLIAGQHQLCILPASKPLPHQGLQPGISVLHSS